jgi:hypothetical protein
MVGPEKRVDNVHGCHAFFEHPLNKSKAVSLGILVKKVHKSFAQ